MKLVWQKGFPTEKGYYWFYGRLRAESKRDPETKGTYIACVWGPHPSRRLETGPLGSAYYVAHLGGHELYQNGSDGHKGLWAKAKLPKPSMDVRKEI